VCSTSEENWTTARLLGRVSLGGLSGTARASLDDVFRDVFR
jgi:hypothetical protein